MNIVIKNYKLILSIQDGRASLAGLNNMTQKELIIEYIKEHGSLLPARIAGAVYRGVMFGSETSKRCRELRADGILESKQDGKFERFFLDEKDNIDIVDIGELFRKVKPLALNENYIRMARALREYEMSDRDEDRNRYKKLFMFFYEKCALK